MNIMQIDKQINNLNDEINKTLAFYSITSNKLITISQRLTKLIKEKNDLIKEKKQIVLNENNES